MRLSEIFAKDIQRPIEGVIKADDVAHLGTEVEEYVLTNEAAKGLEILLEAYTNYTNANGVWISGFFGSGKSHLLKMLAHLLGDVEGQEFPRETASSDSFRAKTALTRSCPPCSRRPSTSSPRASCSTSIRRPRSSPRTRPTPCSKYSSRSSMKAGVTTATRDTSQASSATSTTAASTSAFKTAFERYRRVSPGRKDASRAPWKARAYRPRHSPRVNGGATADGIIKQYQRLVLPVSIEDFADAVKSWLDKQDDPNFRLNFFVDEVGQFTGSDTKLDAQPADHRRVASTPQVQGPGARGCS